MATTINKVDKKNHHNDQNDHSHHGFPWKHVIGLILSLALTFMALWIVMADTFSTTFVMTSIVILAVFQVFVQLFMFMHITESKNKWYQISGIFLGFFIAFAVVAGSLWIMYYTL